MSVGVAAHAVDGAGRASADGVGVATGMLGRDGNGAIRSSYDRAIVVEWIGAAIVDHEARVLRTAHKGDAGSHFHTECFV